MKIITFDCPEGTKKDTMTRILGILWICYLQAHHEVDMTGRQMDQQYKLDDDDVFLYGQLLGEIARSEGRDG